MRKDNPSFRFWLITIALLSFYFVSTNAYAVVPEFDGAYLETNDKQLVEMRSSAGRTNWQGRSYIEKLANVTPIDSENLKGIIVQGRFRFEAATLHPIEKGKIGLMSKAISAWLLKDAIDLRSKGMGDNAYYYEPRIDLFPGKYAFRIGGNLWVFEVKDRKLDKKILSSPIIPGKGAFGVNLGDSLKKVVETLKINIMQNKTYNDIYNNKKEYKVLRGVFVKNRIFTYLFIDTSNCLDSLTIYMKSDFAKEHKYLLENFKYKFGEVYNWTGDLLLNESYILKRNGRLYLVVNLDGYGIRFADNSPFVNLMFIPKYSFSTGIFYKIDTEDLSKQAKTFFDFIKNGEFESAKKIMKITRNFQDLSATLNATQEYYQTFKTPDFTSVKEFSFSHSGDDSFINITFRESPSFSFLLDGGKLSLAW